MYDVKPQIKSLLKSIPDVSVSDVFPNGPAETPRITFYELANVDSLKINNSPISTIAIQIDIWHTRSTGVLAAAVNDVMNSIGFRREFAADVPDPSGIKRKTMRYGGKVDARNLLVYQ
ncbi:hypothetical protein ACFVSW_20195 [Neobacillus sp. NPDC058068]|uniref:hypothetical protein n=1 Tax=Neobacillus sp. NPDC058068 TaxID=3346325 RepID=UPI0036DF8C9F